MVNALRVLALCALVISLDASNAFAAPPPPVVVVFPLTETGIADPQAGERIASLISQELKQTGAVELRDPSAQVTRQQYLEVARKLGADYYLSGFVTVISGQLAVVEQLVSTLGNTTVWSNNARLLTNDDARAQGDLVRDAVIRSSGRAPAAIAVGNLSLAKPARAPAALGKPSFAVLLTGGTSSESDRAYTDAAIMKALRARGFDADLLDEPEGDLSILGPAICASTGARLLLGGTVAVETMEDREINQWATAEIQLSDYDCSAQRVRGVNSGSGATYNLSWAIDRAVDAALRTYR